MLNFLIKLTILIILAFSVKSLENSKEDTELVKSACTHASHAFILNNMDSIEIQSNIENQQVKNLIDLHFSAYLSDCLQKSTPQNAWNVFYVKIPNKIVLGRWKRIAYKL